MNNCKRIKCFKSKDGEIWESAKDCATRNRQLKIAKKIAPITSNYDYHIVLNWLVKHEKSVRKILKQIK